MLLFLCYYSQGLVTTNPDRVAMEGFLGKQIGPSTRITLFSFLSFPLGCSVLVILWGPYSMQAHTLSTTLSAAPALGESMLQPALTAPEATNNRRVEWVLMKII